MQMSITESDACHYPDCASLGSMVCMKCHQSFCMQHVHRRWKKCICEFCFLIEQAQGTKQKRGERIVSIAFILLLVSGVYLLIFSPDNLLGEAFVLVGLFGLAGVAQIRLLR